MATGPRVGYGRGRGSSANREQKPGMSQDYGLKGDTAPRASPMDHLMLLVNNMSPEFAEIEMEPVRLAFNEAIGTKDQLNSAVKLLISRCLRDETFAPCAIELCLMLNDVSVEDTNFRKAFLTLLHDLYKQREELRKARPQTKWIGLVALFAQVASKILLPDNSPMAVIVKVSLESIVLCLDENATDNELECAAVQLMKFCDFLLQHGNRENMKKLRDSVFDVIISGRGKEDTRHKLIDVIEMLNRRPA